MNFTDEQKKALELTPANRIVSAQAGAGKTGVLVERILREITIHHIGLDQMLVVTFTKKAAGEMRSRIREALQQRLSDGNSDPVWIFRQLNLLAAANIQTLHAFCLEVLQRHFDLLDRDPGLHILSGRQLEGLQEEAMENVLRAAYQGTLLSEADHFSVSAASLHDFLACYMDTNRRDDQDLQDLIKQWDGLADASADPEQWMQKSVEEVTEKATIQKIMDGVRDALVIAPALSVERQLRRMEALPWKELPEFFVQFFYRECAQLRATLFEVAEGEKGPLTLTEEQREALMERLAQGVTFRFEKQPSVTEKRDGAQAVRIKEVFQNQREALKNDFKALLAGLEQWNRDAITREQELLQERLRPLAFLATQYRHRLQELKRDANGMDFNDVEHELIRLLQNPEVVQSLKEQYQRIFFDEYQDANAIQEQIVETLAGEDNLFFVGDVKQSIYGFRQALPENFVQRYNRYEASDREQALNLTTNFRSDSRILDFVNRIFTPLMTQQRGGVTYDSSGHRAQASAEHEGKGEVTFCVLEDVREKEDDAEPKSALDEISSEPFYVAHQIVEHVKAGGQYRDCVVLARTNLRMPEYEQVFRRFGIPYFQDASASEEETLELQLAKNLLCFLDNRRYDIPLLSVLLSQMGGFSEEELAQMRAAYPDGAFHEAFLSDTSFVSEALQTKRDRFLAKRNAWRQRYTEMPLSEWMTFLFEESGLLAYLTTLPDGEMRLQNVLALIRLAEDYESREGGDLTGFLKEALRPAGNGEDTLPSVPLSEEDNVVRLMTIHKAKGLQFSVVFLVDLAKKFNETVKKKALVSDPSWGTALQLNYRAPEGGSCFRKKTTYQNLITNAILNKERAEEVRILYVALTRAVHRLYLVGHVTNIEKAKPEVPDLEAFLEKSNRVLDWTLGILSASAEGLSSQEGLEILFAQGEDYRTLPALSDTAFDRENGGALDIDAILQASDLKEETTPLPLKMTVSQLSGKNQILDPHFEDWPWYGGAPTKTETSTTESVEHMPLPVFLQGKVEADPATIGTLLHRALQNLPLKNYTEETMKQALDAMALRALFTEQERSLLSEALLLRFFESSLGQAVIVHEKNVVREHSFTMRLPYEESEIAVDGQIDLFVDLPDGMILVDFKSDRHPNPERYRKQLALYARALQLAYHKPVKAAYLYWIRHGTADRLQ